MSSSYTPTTPQPATVGAASPPAWVSEFVDLFSSAAAHCFLLHGEVRGLMAGGRSHLDYLCHLLAEQFALVLRYDLDAGISFLQASMRPHALALLDQVPGAHNPLMGADPFRAATAPLDALSLIDSLLRHERTRGQVAVLLDYGEFLCPHRDKGQMSEEERAALVKLLKWGRDEELARRNNPLILVTSDLSQVQSELRSAHSGYKSIEIASPTLQEREAYLSLYLRDREAQGKPSIPFDQISLSQIALQTPGLSLWHLEDLLLLGIRRGGLNRALIKEYKHRILSAEYQDVAELVDPLPGGFGALGGMEHLIAWAQQDLLTPIQQGSRDVPKGLLFVGPPGNGKTLFMQALAAELGFNAVSLRMENILGGVVGESERKLHLLFRLVEKLAPALLLFDEADQSDLARRGQGSGNPVAGNLFGQMLQFVGDESKRGRIVLVMASNRPDLFDPALLRPGRIDEVIPFLLPTATARVSIFSKQAMQLGIHLSQEALTLLVERTEQYGAADLMAVLKKARRLANSKEETTQVTASTAERALASIKRRSASENEEYTRLALRFCSDLDLLPQEEREQVRKEQGRASGTVTTSASFREERTWIV